MGANSCMECIVITGNADPGKYCRLPEGVLAEVERLTELAHNTSGIRAAFKTDAGKIRIKAELGATSQYGHMTVAVQSGFDIYCNGAFTANARPEFNGTVIDEEIPLPEKGRMKEIWIYFPLYNSVSSFFVESEKGALNKKAENPQKPIVFYGSSITQGACASRPGNSYVNLVSTMSGRPAINLGFSGNAKGDIAIAEYIAGLDMWAFVYDYDHNAPDTEWLAATHEPFFKTIRSRKPDLPVVMMSRPGYERWDVMAQKNRAVVMTTYLNALKDDDANVYFVDGRTLLGTQNRRECTLDGTHPNDIGFLRMAKNVMLTINEIKEKANETKD